MTTNSQAAVQTQATTTVLDHATIGRLLSSGFTNASPKPPRRLIVKIEGLDKSGKTHLALTAPPPIFHIDIDVGTEGVVEKFRARGKEIYICPVRYPGAGLNEGGLGPDDYKRAWAELQSRINAALSVGKGTLILDTWTEAYEMARLSHFGKLTQVQPHNYPEVYAELRTIIRRVYETEMSAVFIHKMAPKFNSTELEAKGFADTDFLVQSDIRVYRDSLPLQDGRIKTSFRFLIKTMRPRQEAMGIQVASTDPKYDFNYLLYLAHDWVP